MSEQGLVNTGLSIESEGISVVIIERRAFFRDLMLRAFRTPALSVETVASVESLQREGRGQRADVIVLSVTGNKREEDVRKGLATLAKLANAPRVVVLSDDLDADHVMHALELGASGYVSTDMPLAVVVEALRLVRAGGTFAPASSLINNAKRHDVRGNREIAIRGGLFTPRQAAVIEALRRGKSNKIIAYELGMCESTVKVHVRNIMKRLHAKNRTEVAYLTNETVDADI
jgi:DNA-binding NarL/FixJ family response regulator